MTYDYEKFYKDALERERILRQQVADLQWHIFQSRPKYEGWDWVPEHYFSTRGIGANWIECFVCGAGGKESPAQPAAANFVKSKEAGECVIKLFDGKGALLDYRTSEPNWIQVKIGACYKHEPALQHLLNLTTKAGNSIHPEMIHQAKSFAAK